MKNICLNCQKEFETDSEDKKFCSALCKAQTWKASKAGFGGNRDGLKITNNIPFIPVGEGKLFDAIKLEKRTEQFFIFCHSMLWSTRDFSENQQNVYKRLIAEHFLSGVDADETFKNLIEKVILAKRYVLEKPYRFIAEPSDWFNIKYYNGLAGTAKWHDALQEQRNSTPQFGESLKIFSEAILNYADERNLLDIIFYRQIFITQKDWDLLQWYMNAVMHYQFINY
jgi:hypothetical protein